MGLSVKSCLIIVATNVLIAIYFLSTCRKDYDNYGNVSPTVLQIRENPRIDNMFPIVFYKTAYIDYRYTPRRLRVFSMNPCVTPEEFIVAELVGNTTKRVKMRGEPTEGECPWHWASQCLYNSYIWTAELGEDREDWKTIHLKLSNHTVSLDIREVRRKRKKGLTVCVQPVYWYSEFHNIALFIEGWRAQGATRFVVYFHSSTKEVRKMLEHYNGLGILELKPWPSFGNLSRTVSSHFRFPSFDSSTYRVGHTLAQNLCVLEMETELGAVADFDELMVVEGGNLRETSRRMLKANSVGALSFSHLLVKFQPKISTLDYSGLQNPIFLNRTGPSKVLFNSSAVDVVVTHSIRKFIGDENTVQAPGQLLHYRHNSYTETVNEVNSPLKLFPTSTKYHIRRIEKTIRSVLGTSVAPYNSTFLHVLNECISRIVGEDITQIFLHLDNRIVELPVKYVPQKKIKGLTVCVQPVYWYSQIQNIIMFIEAWLSHGAHKFIIYYHSSTKEVSSVLKHYESIGVIIIKPWPKFVRDSWPQKFPDINEGTYRIAHTLAMNLCVLEMETEMGTFVDFDEVIVPPSGDLLSYAENELGHPGVGALEFSHTLMNVKLSNDQTFFDIKQTSNPIFLKKDGPPKMVFNTSSVDIILTHNVRRFISNTRRKTVRAKGALLHNRYDSLDRNLKRKKSTLGIFPSKVAKHVKNMNLVVGKLNQTLNGKVKHDPTIILELNKCIDKLRKSGECRSAVIKCQERLEQLAEWHYDETPDVFVH